MGASGAVCAGTGWLEETLRLVGTAKRQRRSGNAKTEKVGRCCLRLPTGFGNHLCPPLKALHPTLNLPASIPTPRFDFLFHFRPAGRSGKRTNEPVRVNVFPPIPPPCSKVAESYLPLPCLIHSMVRVARTVDVTGIGSFNYGSPLSIVDGEG